MKLASNNNFFCPEIRVLEMFRVISTWNGVYEFKEKMSELYRNCIIKDSFCKIKVVKLTSKSGIFLL